MPSATNAIAVRIGLALGAVSFGFGLLIALLIAFTSATNMAGGGICLGGCVAFLAILGLLIEAGHLAAQRTGRLSSAILAGVISGFLAGAGIGLFSPMLGLLKRPLHSPDSPSLTGLLFVTLVLIVLIGCVFAGFGAGLSALGGLIGQNSYRKRQSPLSQHEAAPRE